MKISRLVTKRNDMAPMQIIRRFLQNTTMTTVQKRILPDIVEKMKHKGFLVELYCVRKQSKQTWNFDRFVTEGERSEPTVNNRNDALLFFYRDVDHDEELGPQIYALTTGTAWKLLKGEIDCRFPKGIGRRILEFRLKVLSSKHLLGEKISSYATYWQTESETFLSFWDCLGDITSKYQMPVKKQSSLYTLLTKNEKRSVNVEISEASITFHKCLTWEDMSVLLIKMSKIFDGNVTDVEMDKDDPRFDVFDHVQLVNSKAEKKKNDDKMKKLLTELLKQSCSTSRLRLLHKDVERWISSDTFRLESSKAAERFILEWKGSSPTLKTVLEACRHYARKKKIPQAALEQLVNDVSIRFGSTETGIFTVKGKGKLIELIEGHFPTDSGISLFRYCGNWYRINVEYLTKIEEQFSMLIEMCCLERDKLPLPWLYPAIKPEKQIGKANRKSKPEKQTIDPDTVKYWIRYLEFSETNNPVKDDIDLEEFLLDETNDVVENQLIARLFSKQRERDYNSGYILYNRIVSQRTNSESGYLLGDNILMKNIELFDLLHYTPECTYLIHVKNGFGHSLRDVCSQIRISADLLYCHMNVTNRFDILQEFWRIATKKKATPYRRAVRRMYKEVGYDRFIQMFQREMCFVLAYRDNINTAQRPTFPTTTSKRLIELCGKDAAESLSRNLAERGFVEKRRGKYYLTDKIFMLTADIVRDIKDMNVSDAEKVVKILKERVSKSFISKMEFIQLYSYFRKFSRGACVFSLRIYSIENHNMMHGSNGSGSEASPFSHSSSEYCQEEKPNKRTHNSERPRSPALLSSHSSPEYHQKKKPNKRTHDSERSRSATSLSSHSSPEYRQKKKPNKRTHDNKGSRSSSSVSSHSSPEYREREEPNKRTYDSERLRISGSPTPQSNAEYHQRETHSTQKLDKYNLDGKCSTQKAQKRTSDTLLTNDIGLAKRQRRGSQHHDQEDA
ncbi:uncharacterized protein [Haliotis asinina]|uniref:uncharacterized protein n=1 Tax=Haliotis asinina TaxID=109174 RepID=UPI0035326BEC